MRVAEEQGCFCEAFGTDKKALMEMNLGEGHSTSTPNSIASRDDKTPTRAGTSSTLHLKVEYGDSKLA